MSSVIQNTIHRADGLAQENVKVVIEILWDKTEASIATDPTHNVTIDSPNIEYTDSNGQWATTVVANSVVLPADSVYRVTETSSDDETPSVYYVSVPDNGEEYWVGDIFVDAPEWVES